MYVLLCHTADLKSICRCVKFSLYFVTLAIIINVYIYKVISSAFELF
jgi:hypothetical protein